MALEQVYGRSSDRLTKVLLWRLVCAVALLTVWLPAPVASATSLVTGVASVPGGHLQQSQQEPETVVSLTFDGTFKGQVRASEMLEAANLPGTFYINSGYLDFPAYLSIDQLRSISRAGHEVGGASLYGNDLSRQTYENAKKEVCDDRATLAQLGNQVTSFAYPHGADTSAQARSVVKACGYNSGRDVAGLYESPTVCSSCPPGEMLPPKDDFSVRTAAPSQSLPALKEHVERAEEGGGWVPLVFSRICACPDKISAGDAISPKDFEDFVAWLADRPDSTRVRTVDQVMGGELKPVIGAPLPRVVPDPSTAIGSPASPADDESPWALLGGRNRSQALALAAAVGLAILAALGAARRSNRGRGAVSVAAGEAPAASSRRSVPKAALAVVAVAAVGALVGAALLVIGDVRLFGGSTSEGPEAAANRSGAPADRLSVEPPAAFSAPGTYVQSRVTASGDVRVVQWVVTAEKQPISSLDLALPPLPTSGSVSVAATDLVVAADQVRVRTPSTVGAAGRVLRFAGPARAVYLAYTLRGAVETSESVPGRVLVRATTLSSRYRPRVGPTRVTVSGGAVLSMACAGPSAPSLSPCGGPVDGRWRAVLQGPDRAGGVAAVVTLT